MSSKTSKSLLEESLDVFGEAPRADYEAANTVMVIGNGFHLMGNLAAAQQRYQEALALFQEIDEKSGIAMALTNIGEILCFRGELDEARAMHEEALAMNREIGDKSGEAYDLFRLGDVFASKGDLVIARDRYEAALDSQIGLNEEVAAAAETRFGLANLAIAEGKASEAESLARAAEEVLRTEDATDLQALAQAALAHALLAQNKPDEARTLRNSIETLAATSSSGRVGLATGIAIARIEASSGAAEDVTAALEILEDTSAAAKEAGFAGLRAEARLAMGEIELTAGRFDTAKAHLEVLVIEAKAKGFSQIEERGRSPWRVPRDEINP